MKTITTACLALLLCTTATAQSNFYKMSFGGGLGVTTSYADVERHRKAFAGNLVFDYYFTPFISLGVEGQMGEVAGGDIDTDPYHRQFINQFKAFAFTGKVALGAVTDYEHNNFLDNIKGLYIGSGVGLIQNKMTGIVRRDPVTDAYYPGSDESKDLRIPINLGIDFFFPNKYGQTRLLLNVNYQGNIILGEGLDGYDDSSRRFRSGSPDIYTFLSIGLRYQFGQIGLSKKSFF